MRAIITGFCKKEGMQKLLRNRPVAAGSIATRNLDPAVARAPVACAADGETSLVDAVLIEFVAGIRTNWTLSSM